MKAIVVFVVIAAVGIVLALLVGTVARQAAPVPDTGEILAGAGQIVESLVDSDVRFVQQVYVWSTWANGVYLTQSMPYTFIAGAGAVLALGLGLALMVTVRLWEDRDEI